MDKLYELKDQLIDEIVEYADKGKKSKDDALTLKALTGSVDHLCNIIHDMDDEYSGAYRSSYMRGGSYRDGSYARGRGRNANRDSMGRYSREGLADKLRDLMEEAPDDHTRMEIKRLVDKM